MADEEPVFNAGVSYALEIHNMRTRANGAIEARDFGRLHSILTGYHIALVAELLRRKKNEEVKRLQELKTKAMLVANTGGNTVEGYQVVYSQVLQDWFGELSNVTHASGLAMPKSDGMGAARRV